MAQTGIIDNYGQFHKEKVFYKIYKCTGEEMQVSFGNIFFSAFQHLNYIMFYFTYLDTLILKKKKFCLSV